MVIREKGASRPPSSKSDTLAPTPTVVVGSQPKLQQIDLLLSLATDDGVQMALKLAEHNDRSLLNDLRASTPTRINANPTQQRRFWSAVSAARGEVQRRLGKLTGATIDGNKVFTKESK